MTSILNLVLQSISLTISSKTEKRYYWTKIGLFAITMLVVPTLLRFAHELVMVKNLGFFIGFFISSLRILLIFFFIPYIIIIALFYFFDKPALCASE